MSSRWNSGRLSSISADGVAALHPERGQPRGDPLDALGVLAPGERDGVAGVAQRDLVGPLGGGVLERVDERRRVEGERPGRGGRRGVDSIPPTLTGRRHPLKGRRRG